MVVQGNTNAIPISIWSGIKRSTGPFSPSMHRENRDEIGNSRRVRFVISPYNIVASKRRAISSVLFLQIKVTNLQQFQFAWKMKGDNLWIILKSCHRDRAFILEAFRFGRCTSDVWKVGFGSWNPEICHPGCPCIYRRTESIKDGSGSIVNQILINGRFVWKHHWIR